jgi:hypothetical protein
MNWTTTLPWWPIGLLLSLPVLVVLLYFLKLRRLPLVIPSTIFWQKAIEDVNANSLWQKLRSNLLLLLQLLFLLAILLAIFRPSRIGNQTAENRCVLLIDNSASMSATDVQPSRLQQAKELAKEKIASMKAGETAMVVAFADRVEVKQGFTSDRQSLRSALDAIEPTQRPSNLQPAIQAAQALAMAISSDTTAPADATGNQSLVHIFSDGGFGKTEGINLENITLDFTAVGTQPIDNVAIEAFEVVRSEEQSDQVAAFAKLSNHGGETVEMTTSLLLDDKLIDAVNTTIDPGAKESLEFSFEFPAESTAQLRLEIDRPDQLKFDNQAYAVLKRLRPTKVTVFTPGNTALEKALATRAIRDLAEVTIESIDKLSSINQSGSSTSLDQYDLVIFDRCSPSSLPQTNTFFIGSTPPGESWKLGALTGPIQLIDVDRSHPITQAIEIGSIRIVEGRAVECIQEPLVLLRSDIGPVLVLNHRQSHQDIVLGFELVHQKGTEVFMNTDWGIKRSFPIFIYSIIEFLAEESNTLKKSQAVPGQPLVMNLGNQFDRVQVVEPNGNQTALERSSNGKFVWAKTETAGIYKVLSDQSERVDSLAVNFFFPDESQLRVTDEISVGERQIAAQGQQTRSRQEYWRWLVLGSLVLLVTEWLLFSRRLAG